jgi:8-oxo-dGTP pyrophosphatase MutT (NUDIX family)
MEFTSIHELASAMQKLLQLPLPGLQLQLNMAPPYREVPSEDWVRAQNPRLAGVLLLLCVNEEGWRLVFTKRKAYAGVHSAQVSFPGGKLEKSDADLQMAALRETEEEIGVPASKVKIAGPMTPLYIPPSNFLVHPFVGILTEQVDWRLDPTEVDVLLEIPISFLLQDAARANRLIQVGSSAREVPGFVWEDHFIWGATAMMLEEFLAIFVRLKEECM